MKKNSRTSQRLRYQKQGFLIVLTAIAITIGALAIWHQAGLNEPAETTGQETTTVKPATSITETVNPTTETTRIETSATLSPVERQARLADAASDVSALLANKNGRFAVYYHNLAAEEIWQYNDEMPFVAASSIKIGLNTYLYSRIASGDISLDDVLIYDNRAYPTGDYEGGTGTIQNKPNGTPFSVRETSSLSIRISDNCATNMIIRRLGGIDQINEKYLFPTSHVVDYRSRVSYVDFTGKSQRGLHRTSARDLGLHAVNLYRLWQDNPKIYQPLIDDLCETTFDFGIHKGIPENIMVAHKIGTNGMYSTENDVGIVFADEPFVLCVMTEMSSAAAAHQIQAQIAEIFFEYINNLQIN